MRTIKFRGKSGDEWVYGDLSTSIYGTYGIIDFYGKFIEVDLDSIGQYTGVKDVNGNEIYEGDIVETFTLEMVYQQVGSYPPPNVEVEEWEIKREVNVVEFIDGSFCIGDWPMMLFNDKSCFGESDLSSDEERFKDMWGSNSYDVQDRYPYLTWQHFLKPHVIGNVYENLKSLSKN